MRNVHLVLALVLLAGRPAAAGSEPLERARAAVGAGDEKTLEELANAGGDAVWKLVTALCARGELEEAEVVARHARRAQDARLAAHVAAWRAWTGDRAASRAAYERVAAAEQAWREGRPGEAFLRASTARPPAGAPAALEVRAATVMMVAAQAQDRTAAVVEQGQRGARLARELGWWFRESMCLNPLLALLLSAGRLPEAEPLARRAIENARELGDESAVAFAEGRLAGILGHTYRFEEALEHYRRGAAWYDARPATERPAELYHGLGSVLLATGDLVGAVTELEKARANPTADDPGLGVEVLLTLAEGQHQLGRYADAESLFAEAAPLVAALRVPRHEVRRLLGAALLARTRGEFADAVEAYEGAVAVARGAGDADAVAAAVGGLAAMLQALGDPSAARRLAVEALEAADPSKASPAVVTLHGILAGIERERGALREARTHYEAMRDMAKALEDDPRRGAALAGLGTVAEREGRPDEARAALEEALALARARGDVAAAATALALSGESFARAGRWDEALGRLAQAQRSAEEVGALEVATYARSALAEARRRQGDAEGALALAREGVHALARFGRLHADERSAALVQEWAAVHETGARAALSLGRVEDALAFVEQSRAEGLRRVLGARDALPVSVVAPALVEDVAAARAVLDAATTARAQGRPGARDLRAAKERLARAEDRLAAEVARAAPLLAAAPDVTSLPASVGPGTALVEYVRLGDGWQAFVLETRGTRAVALGSDEGLEAEIDELLRARRDPGAAEEAATRLRARLVAPLALDAGLARVVVAPDGALHRLPWSLLFPRREVALVPSASVHALLAARREPPGTGVLALGGVPMARLDPARSVGLLRSGLADLPHAREEAQAVGTRVLLGDEASEQAFLALASAQRWRAVHVACHGLLDDVRPRFSALALAPSPGSDGFLTQGEIARSMVTADLVTLSACDTALGKVYRGAGLVGLSQAFLHAGAPRVIASLWKVDDLATSALMQAFYAAWRPPDGAPGLSTAASLRKAQEAVRAEERWKAPQYWAAWVLYGRSD